MRTLNASTAAATSSVATLPGFADPVGQAQTNFRAALNALAHPGRIQNAHPPCSHPTQLSAAATALLLTLADGDTPVWLPAGVSEDVKRYLRFHCGCPLVDAPAKARFVVAPAGFERPSLGDCDPGDPAYPDRSATLLLEVASLAEGSAVRLDGPGIATWESLSIAGLDAAFWIEWQHNHRRFPMGVDIFFTQGERFSALPRTTRAEEQKCM